MAHPNELNLVSIITPSFNSEDYIKKTIDSVIAQTYENWELIISDDFSSDATREIIKKYAKKDDRISYIFLEKNSGAAISRNKAIEMAKGRFIAFLDSDDTWNPEKLQIQIKFMLDNDVAFSYTSFTRVTETGEKIKKSKIKNKVKYNDLLKSNSIGCLTAVYDTKMIGKVYMPEIRRRQDLGLWLKILKKTEYAYGIDKELAKYTVRRNSISSKKTIAARYTWKLYREVEKINFIKSMYYFTHYTINGILKNK